MKRCTRCGIDTKGANECPDCDDVIQHEVRRWAAEQRIEKLLKRRDKLDVEIRELLAQLEPKTHTGKRPRNIIPACGTESAYQRHRNRREPCPEGDACRLAHNAHERAAKVLRDARKAAA